MSIVLLRCKRHNREQRLPFSLVQYAMTPDGRRAMRRLTESGGNVVKGAWAYTARPFDDGLYCQHCLNEGRRTPQPVDPEDLPDLGLGDAPMVFRSPDDMDAGEIVAALREAYPGSIRYVKELPPVPARYADDTVLNRLHSNLRQVVRDKVLGEYGRLYTFQAEAIAAALDGRHTVITTPTASGKTFTYLLPVLDGLLRDSTATALYISPLVALTADQLAAVSAFDRSGTDWESKAERFTIYRHCRTLDFGAGSSVTVARYDGSVSQGDRQTIRKKQPQMVLTTADMLHAALLAGGFAPTQWDYLFAGLKYVVLDELHTYRGVLGAGFANLLRRLRRICAAHGSSPQFLAASATIVDPAATVERLVGVSPTVVSGEQASAPQARRQFVVWSDNSDEDQRALSTQAKNVLLTLLENRVRTIAFGRSIGEINDIYRFARAELRETGQDGIALSPFMRELRGDTKRQLIRQLKEGSLHAIVSTTALSMGIDIGTLSAALIIGFPGSIAQMWQQAGRAGRAGEGVIVLVADRDAMNQFFANHPEVLFDLQAEPIYLNPDNPYVVRGHLLCAARELPLQAQEVAQFGPSAQDVLGTLVSSGLLVSLPDQSAYVPTEAGQEAAGQVSFRNLSFAIDVQVEESRETIVQVDAARAQRALHKYAHYQHVDRYYQVTQFDVDFMRQRGQIMVQELERAEYTTTAVVERAVSMLERGQSARLGAATVAFARVACRTDVTGYYQVPLFARNEPFRYQPLGRAAPPTLTYDTQAIWLTLDEWALRACPPAEQSAALYSLAGALRLATAVEELCDPSDIDALSVPSHPETDLPTIVLYDAVPGGVGITEAAMKRLPRILQRALDILEQCPYCATRPESRGCPYCVTAPYGDESTINRMAAIELVKQLLPVSVAR